jgi:uncharacterized protein with HEPN domain/predicted nucleotidyltransferase
MPSRRSPEGPPADRPSMPPGGGDAPVPGEDLLLALNRLFPVLRKMYGIRRIGIFGPTARGERETGDAVEIEVEFFPGEETYVNFAGLALHLQEVMGYPLVPVTTRVLEEAGSGGGMRTRDLPLIRLERETMFLEEFMKGVTFQQFLKDSKLRHAALRALLVVTSAASSVPPDIRVSHKNVPWKELMAFPPVLTDWRFDPDPAILWDLILAVIATGKIGREAGSRMND